MRKFILLCSSLYLCVSLLSATERKTSTLFENAPGGVWVNSSKQTYTYSNDSTYTILQQSWNTSSNLWENSSLLEHYYKSNDDCIYFLQKLWNSTTSTWDNDTKFVYSYNSNNKVDTIRVQLYTTGSWETNSLQLYTYTGNNFTVCIKTLNSTTHLWENSSLTEYLADGSGNITGYTSKYWDATNSIWLNNYNGTISYSGLKKSAALYQSWTSNAWKNSSRETYTYTPATYAYLCFNETWDSASSTWKPGSQITYQNNSNDNLLSYTYQLWNSTNSSWDNFNRCTNTYETTALAEDANLSFQVFPNPCTEYFSLSMPNADKAYVDIYDLNGNLVLSKTVSANKNEMSVSGFASGMYVIQVLQGDKRGVAKLMKK